MFKKVFIGACILFALCFAAAYADEAPALLSGNQLDQNDLILYSASGTINQTDTGATYSWTADSDAQIKTTTAQSGQEMITGHVTSSNSAYVGDSTWDAAGTSTIIFDLKDIYKVNRVDLWHLASYQKQLGDIEIKVSRDGKSYRSVGVFSPRIPTIADGDTTHSYPVLDSCRFDGTNARFVSITIRKGSVTGTGAEAHAYTIGEFLVFGGTKGDDITMNLISDNALNSGDYGLYSAEGINVTATSTGADYEWTADSDEDMVRTSSENGNKEMVTGNVNNSSGTYVGNSTWGAAGTSTAIFDLQQLCSVSCVDLWHISTQYAQVGNVVIKASYDGTSYETVGEFTAAVPYIEGAESKAVHDSFAFNPVTARYISITASKAATSGSGITAQQQILGEMLIFGDVGAIDDRPWVGELKLCDSEGDRLYTYPADGNVNAEIEAKNCNALLVLAAYDENDNLKTVDITEGKMEAIDTKYSVNAAYQIDAQDKPAYIKAMVFDGKKTVTPLTKCSVLKEDDITMEGLLSSYTPLFPDVTKVYKTNPTYEWVTNGVWATDSSLLGGTAELFDGSNDTSRTTSSSTTEDANGNIIIHLDSEMEISRVVVRSMCSDTSYMDTFDVYASSDNSGYTQIATGTNTSNAKLKRVMATECPIGHKVYARDIKVVMHKKSGVSNMQIAEVEVYGKPATLGRIRATDYSYNTEVPFVTNNDIIASDGGCTALSDNNKETKLTSTGDYVTLLYTLDEYCQIDEIKVHGRASGMEFLVSPDGATYRNVGYYECDGGIFEAHGVPGKNAKYVKLVIHKGSLQNIELSEVYVYGRKLFDENAEVHTEDIVRVYTELKPNNILYLDWTDYDERANGVSGEYNVFIEETNFTSTSGKSPVAVYTGGGTSKLTNITAKYCNYVGLAPDKDYYVAVIPRSTTVAYKNVVPTKIHTYSALGNEKLTGIFCINDYPEGGGAHQPHDDEAANLNKKIKLLSAMENMQRTRWWYGNLGTQYPQYPSNGISFIPLSGASSAEAVRNLNAQGVYITTSSNEPDINTPYMDNPLEFTNLVKEHRTYIDEAGSPTLLAEASICGTDKLPWFESLYDTDPNFGSYYDVVDAHLYCKKFEGQQHKDDSYTDFETPSVPEHLAGKVTRIKNVLSAKGDNPNKPIITTEIGWSTHTQSSVESTQEMVNAERQGNYQVRAYLNGIKNGIANMYIYAFQDEYYQTSNLEWQFGMVDWYGNPKPGYYTCYTLMKVLKDAEYLGETQGAYHPIYGLSFWDESANGFITALWMANGIDTNIQISSTEGVRVIDAFGNVTANVPNGTVKIGKSPVYVLSDERISVQ